jgi:tetratricopeptide (TPR) repeat protein
VRAARHHDAAELAEAAGRDDDAMRLLREALAIAPQDEDALEGVTSRLVQQGADGEAAKLLARALPRLAPPGDQGARLRGGLWRRLGETRLRLGDERSGLMAFDRALAFDPSLREVRQEIVARLGMDPAHDELTRPHLEALVAETPLDPPSVRALSAIAARRGEAARALRLTELLAVAGAATDEELRSLRRAAKAQHADEPYPGAIADDAHDLLAHPDARDLGELFAALWEGAGAQAPGLDALGVGPDDRASPVSGRDVAGVFGACARALGNRRTALYVRREPGSGGVTLVAQPPTAIVVGARLAEGRASASLRFLLGRALELARPEYALAAALELDELGRRFGSLLRAFNPGESDADLQRWRRELPYKIARRLAEILNRPVNGDATARYRRGVLHTGNRAGLLLCGDLVAATAVLRAEGDEAAVEELARFAASSACEELTAQLSHPAAP